MANNYFQFCEKLEGLKVKEMSWLRTEYVKRTDPTDGQDYVDRDETHGDFQLDVERENKVAYVFAEESGNVDHAAEFIQLFLKKFRPNGCFTIGWSYSCSSPRPGEFGGGRVFITAKSMKWFNPDEMTTKASDAFLKKQKGKKRAHRK